MNGGVSEAEIDRQFDTPSSSLEEQRAERVMTRLVAWISGLGCGT